MIGARIGQNALTDVVDASRMDDQTALIMPDDRLRYVGIAASLARPALGLRRMLPTRGLRPRSLDDRNENFHRYRVDGDDLFFLLKDGGVWACWLSGKPAVRLGSQAEATSAMQEFVDKFGGSQESKPPAPAAPHSSPKQARPISHSQDAQPSSIEPLQAAAPDPEMRILRERGSPRHELTIIGRIFTSRGSRDVTILDLSDTGCRLADHASQLAPDTRLTVKLGPVGPVEATVRWRRGDSVGIQFCTPLYPAVLEHIRSHFDLRRRG